MVRRASPRGLCGSQIGWPRPDESTEGSPMAKILFINPLVREEDDPRHVPYGIALLASLAMKDGHLVQVYDANAWRASDAVLAQVLKADAWDVVGIGGITTAYAGV